MAKVVSKTYGEALFELARERDAIDRFSEEVSLLSEGFEENPELGRLLCHPKITKEEKKGVIERCFSGRLCDDLVGFLVLLVDKDRCGDLEEILSYFSGRVLEYKRIGVAHVASAVELTDAQKRQIEEKLLAQTSYESFRMDYRVDKALLGGMVIRIGDRVADSSVRTKLEHMAKELRKLSLA